tara:strand:- start:809 stop:1312 length:504 start_codon:yes stop_codon:yes gene_type:complete
MKFTKKQLKKIIQEEYSKLKKKGLIREFGENDAQLRKKLQNRDRMIGRGIDGGTIGYNPNWDYDKKSYGKRKKGIMGDVIKQVKSVIEKNDIYSWIEVEATNNPEIITLVSGDMKVKVENEYGLFKFSVVQPPAWRGWSMECYSIDDEIDNVLYELGEYVNKKEGNS